MNRERQLPTSRREVGKPRISFNHVRRHPGVLENEIRVEWPLDADWVRVYRLRAEDGRPVIADLHLIPTGSRQPAGGITHDKVRQLHTDRVLTEVQSYLEWREDKFGPGDRAFLDHVLLRFELDPQKVVGDVTASRHRRTDTDLARAAEAIATADDGGWRQAVADEMCCSTWTAYKWRTAARDRGFLDGDDELTDRARQILDASDSRPR